jgi:hypothetical protein
MPQCRSDDLLDHCRMSIQNITRGIYPYFMIQEPVLFLLFLGEWCALPRQFGTCVHSFKSPNRILQLMETLYLLEKPEGTSADRACDIYDVVEKQRCIHNLA